MAKRPGGVSPGLMPGPGRFPETAHLVSTDTEHRENYSMGGGNFLSDHGSSDSGTGWVVRSRDLPCAYVSLTEDAVPEPQAAPGPVTAARRPQATQPAAPKPVRATAISANVLDILRSAVAEGNAVRISGRLGRVDYVAVNEVLTAAGGKWNRKAQAHLFDGDAAPVLASLLGDGSIVRPQDEGWFPTPDTIVADMLALAGLTPGMEVLEPSAGEGAIASAVAQAGCAVDCTEVNAKRAGVIYAAGYARSVTMADFLAVPQRPAYDRVLMNPPFADKADIAHVTHALGFARPGGTVVAIMSAGVEFRQDKVTEAFRKLVADRGGRIERLPDDSFKESGTGVRTVMAVIPASVQEEELQMQVSELFDIEPSHEAVAEISRRRIDHGDGYAPVGYATLWLAGLVPGAGPGDSAVFRVSGVRGENLLVRYEHSRRPEPYFWVHASVFPDGIEILSRYRQPLPERYWHPNWRGINALPPEQAS